MKRKMTKKRRIIGVLLCIMLVLGTLPVGSYKVLADDYEVDFSTAVPVQLNETYKNSTDKGYSEQKFVYKIHYDTKGYYRYFYG